VSLCAKAWVLAEAPIEPDPSDETYAAAKARAIRVFTESYIVALMRRARRAGWSMTRAGQHAGLDRPNFRRLLRGVVPDGLGIACSRCGAAPGVMCHNAKGVKLPGAHFVRRVEAFEASRS
jgi:hypothetical protein